MSNPYQPPNELESQPAKDAPKRWWIIAGFCAFAFFAASKFVRETEFGKSTAGFIAEAFLFCAGAASVITASTTYQKK